MKNETRDWLFQVGVLSVAFYLVAEHKQIPETKICCNCGITYVVNHKSYCGSIANNMYNFCRKDCLFSLKSYYKFLTDKYEISDANKLLREFTNKQTKQAG